MIVRLVANDQRKNDSGTDPNDRALREGEVRGRVHAEPSKV